MVKKYICKNCGVLNGGSPSIWECEGCGCLHMGFHVASFQEAHAHIQRLKKEPNVPDMPEPPPPPPPPPVRTFTTGGASPKPVEPKECPNKQCCCNCRSQIRLHICSCGKCPSKIGGYVCDAMSENGERVGWYMGKQGHGECELYWAKVDERDKP